MRVAWVLGLGILAGCARPRAIGTDSREPSRTPSQGRFASAPPERSESCAAGVACASRGATCTSGEQTCTCRAHCSGVDWGDQTPPDSWVCQVVPKGCPAELPSAGAPCRKNGLRCGYGSCGGATATCTNRAWTVQAHPPPA